MTPAESWPSFNLITGEPSASFEVNSSCDVEIEIFVEESKLDLIWVLQYIVFFSVE